MMGHANRVGTLEAGKRADLIIIDRDIVALAATDPVAIADTQVDLTMFDGQVIFERE